MATVIFAWNPKNWQWPNLTKSADEVSSGIEVIEESSTHTKQAQPGDRFFIVRVGVEPKGIYASGHIIKGPYENLHWDEEKRHKGITQTKYEIKFDKLLVPDYDPLLDIEELQQKFPLPHKWTPQSSGILLSDEVAEQVDKLWEPYFHRQYRIPPEKDWIYPYKEHHMEQGLKLLPYLVNLAKIGQTRTYSEAAGFLDVHHRALRFPLGFIRDCICLPNNIPLLSVLIVSKGKNLPSKGFLLEGHDKLTELEYKEKVDDFLQQVILFNDWDKLLISLNLKPLEVPNPSDHLDSIGREYTRVLKKRTSFTGGGEGEAHLKLKKYIAYHPEAIGLSKDCTVEIEYQFIAGDEADVVFRLPNGGYHIVEIKKGPSDGELIKGVYQLIKYGALLWAEKKHQTPGRFPGTLVAYEIPVRIQKFASQFMFDCYEIKRNAVE